MKSPKIRFKGFDGDWEQRKFGETVIIERGGSPRPIDAFITDDENGLNWVKIGDAPEQGNYITKTAEKICPEGLKKTREVHPGDLILSNSMSFGRPYIMAIDGCIHDGWLLIRDEEKRYDLKFLCQMLGTEQMLAQYRAMAAGSTVNNLNKELVGNTEVKVPSIAEQAKIGEYFSKVDDLITLHQKKFEQLTILKKYMLQKMFPQNGSDKPEIRFDGFTDDWEQRKFGDLADYKKGPFGSAITKDMFVPKTDEAVKVYEQQNAINKDWSLERYFLPKSYALSKLKSFEVYGGDIIVSCAGTIGEIYEIPENADPGVINQALMRVRVNEDIVDKKMFIISFSNMIDEFTRTHSNGSAIKNIPPFADLKPMEVLMPSMIEQRKISDYFSNLDHLITLHQQKCDELRNAKKFMLQNMFI